MQQQTETALEENKKEHSTVGGILSSGILSGHRRRDVVRKTVPNTGSGDVRLCIQHGSNWSVMYCRGFSVGFA